MREYRIIGLAQQAQLENPHQLFGRSAGQQFLLMLERELATTRDSVIVLDFSFQQLKLDYPFVQEVFGGLVSKRGRTFLLKEVPADIADTIDAALHMHLQQNLLGRKNLALMAYSSKGRQLLGRLEPRLFNCWRHIEQWDDITAAKLADSFQVTLKNANYLLKALSDLGLLERVDNQSLVYRHWAIHAGVQPEPALTAAPAISAGRVPALARAVRAPGGMLNPYLD
jgi:hypothetical protein